MEKHKHHIIPVHVGGSNDPSNLVELTIDEHAEAHRKLYEQYGRWQDKIAWLGLSKQITGAELVRERNRLAMTGRTLSEETKQRISDAKRGKSTGRRGIPFTDAHRQAISDAKAGKVSRNTPITKSERKAISKRMTKSNPMSNPEYRKKMADAVRESWARRKSLTIKQL